jgi:hypothetical protein
MRPVHAGSMVLCENMMNLILRNYFYSFGISMMMIVSKLPPETAQFRDLVAIMHGSSLWIMVSALAVILIGVDLVFSGRIPIPWRPDR